MADLNWSPSNELFFKVLLRDHNPDMVAAWQDPEAFGDGKYTDLVEVRRRKLVTDGHKFSALIHCLRPLRSQVGTSLRRLQQQMQS